MLTEARFELEQAIVATGNVADDIDMLVDVIMNDEADKERMINALVGIKELHEMRCKKAFDIFSAMIRDGLIA